MHRIVPSVGQNFQNPPFRWSEIAPDAPDLSRIVPAGGRRLRTGPRTGSKPAPSHESNPCGGISGCLCCWAHMGRSQIRAVEFPGACAAGYTWWPAKKAFKSGSLHALRLNFRVLVLLGTRGALSNPCCRISGCLCCWAHMVAGCGALKSVR